MRQNEFLWNKGLTHITPSQTSPGFYVSAVQVFWKHYENTLVTSNFSFSHSVF